MNDRTLQWILLAVAALLPGVVWAELAQNPGVDYLAFQGEAVGQVLNPDAANDVRLNAVTGSPESPAQVWTVEVDGSALGGARLKAPPSPHRQNADPSLQESIAVYRLRFVTSGIYQAYLRVRNNGTPGNGSSDSLWAPTGWDQANPSQAMSTGQTGGYEWRQPAATFAVSAGQVGSLLEFRVGVRESDACLDAVVFSLQGGLDAAMLDGLVPAPPPPPTSGLACVSTLSALHAAIAAARPGDTILMCNGVWRDTVIHFTADGAPGRPITLRAEVDGQVRLEGESQLFIAGDYLVVQGLLFTNGTTPGGDVIQFRRAGASDYANHSRLTECAMIGYNPVDPTTNYKWVSVYGISNRVDHCHFSGMNHIGVTLTVWPRPGGPANHTRIDGNYFGDRAPGTGNGFETIRIGTSDVSNQDSLALVESNLFVRCNGEIEIISSKSVGNVYRRNTFLENSGQLTLRHGSACRVEENFFLGNGVAGSSGVRIVGPDHVVVNNYFANLSGTGIRAALAIMNGVPSSPLNRYLRAERDRIGFNTFVDCADTFVIGTTASEGDTTLPPADCVVANNLVRSSQGPLIEYVSPPENLVYEGNILYGASTGIPATPGVTVVNPLLALDADGLMRPATNSPVVDAAAGSYPDVLVDMDGHGRTAGTQDVGADEVVPAPAVRLPLGLETVGPRWTRPSRLDISEVIVSPGEVEVTFADLTGLAPVYTLERASDLVVGDWSSVTGVVPAAYTAAVFSVKDPTQVGTSGYYRVVNQ